MCSDCRVRGLEVFSQQQEETVSTMPIYVYKCHECGITFERFQHFSEEPLKVCPECNGPVVRVIQPVGIIFKGSGFYVTDHKGSGSSLLPKPDSKRREEEAGPAREGGADAPTTQAPQSEGD